MTSNQLTTYPHDKGRALVGLSPSAFSALLEAVVPALLSRRRAAQQAQRDRKRAVGGGRKRGLTPEQEVMLTLVYLRHNVAHAIVGHLFGVSADTSENTFHEVVAVLRDVCPANRWDAEKKWKQSEPSWKPDELDQLIVDSFETPVSRPGNPEAQRRLYSGKKKRHTLKTQVVTDAAGEIVEISAGHRGPSSDKRLYEQSGVQERYPAALKRADLGYQGITGMLVPHKKPPQRPKKRQGKSQPERSPELTPEQREENRQHARARVSVEHGIRRLKAFRIVRDEYRLAPGLFPMIASSVVGLVQLVRLVG
jgi:hypothetical protein